MINLVQNKEHIMADITARDLANMLGISTAAVSMALNGKPGVSSETRTMVLAAATKLGYVTPKSRQSERQAKNIVSFVIYFTPSASRDRSDGRRSAFGTHGGLDVFLVAFRAWCLLLVVIPVKNAAVRHAHYALIRLSAGLDLFKALHPEAILRQHVWHPRLG